MRPIETIRLIVHYKRDIVARTDKRTKSIKFLLQALLHLHAVGQWLRFIGPYCERFGYAQPPMDMVVKLTKRYGGKHLSVAEAVRRLQAHYRYIAEYFSPETVRRLLDTQAMPLCTLHGKSSRSYSIHLHHHIKFQREGELTLGLYQQESGDYLGYLTFSLAQLKNGAPFIWISCLQGDNTDGSKERVVKATRDLHGLRPKTILLESVYVVAEFFHAEELRAIANRNHAFAGSKKKRISADYDGFWEESGGVKLRNGNFLLPATMKRRVLDDVPAHKRKDWLKRQEHIAHMQADIRSALNQLKKPATR